MLSILFIFAFMGVVTTFVGYWSHIMFHQTWSKWFYMAHMNHHKIQYPAIDFISTTYRNAGKDNTTYYFIIAFLPLILLIFTLSYFGIYSLTTAIISFISLSIWGGIHSYLHDQFHISTSIWSRFSFFKKLTKLHYLHHLNMNMNFGIFTFIYDKLFKTFEDHS